MTLPHLIGITGLKRSGKDSVARVLIERYGYTRIGFADTLKEMALAIDPVIPQFETGAIRHATARQHVGLAEFVEHFGWERAKENQHVRRFLQRLGTEGVRNHLGANAWIDAWYRRAQPINLSADGDHPRIVVPDVRFANEAHTLRLAGGTIWRVERAGAHSDGHASETELDTLYADQTISNNGTLDELADKVDVLVDLAARSGGCGE